MNFRDKLKQNGYDAEDAYFYKKDLELIAKAREANARAKNHLKLLNGGASDVKQLPAGRSSAKKAA